MTITTTDTTRYLEPNGLTRWFMNPLISAMTRVGISVWGSRVLEIRGRTSGEWRSVPVNPLALDGGRYLVAPRGETQWVRNLRVAGTGRLRKGRRVEEFGAVEIVDVHDRLPILRAYLDKWAFEVGAFFEGITVDSTDAELLAVAPGFPVFRITTT
ncbi:deazaflavin-dependent nitroreductase [Ilumatobacter sp.]|uniref:deazaflavin-dependent nitroreductase n=1 Tax=Ilumatobacter sp. TaxID=1967498 RepID=UPI003C4CF80C